MDEKYWYSAIERHRIHSNILITFGFDMHTLVSLQIKTTEKLYKNCYFIKWIMNLPSLVLTWYFWTYGVYSLSS